MDQTNQAVKTTPQNPSTLPPGQIPTTSESLPDIMREGAPGLKPKKPLLPWMFVAILAVVSIILLVLVFNYSSKASTTQQALDSQYKSGYDKGYAKGTQDQSASDNKAFQEQLIRDTRLYRSPSEFGSFELNLPKSWSWSINPKPSDGTFSGVSDPEFVDITSKSHTFSLELKREDFDRVVKQYQDETSKSAGKITASDAVVSGIAGKRFKGVFNERTNQKAEIVVIPLREKVMIFKTDNPDQYSDAFNTILSTTKLNP